MERKCITNCTADSPLAAWFGPKYLGIPGGPAWSVTTLPRKKPTGRKDRLPVPHVKLFTVIMINNLLEGRMKLNFVLDPGLRLSNGQKDRTKPAVLTDSTLY